MGFDLGELEFSIIRIHCLYLLSSRSSQHLYNLDQLINPTLSWKQRLSKQQLSNHASYRPNINRRRVVCASEDQLGRPVVSGADVGDIGLPLDQSLCGSEVAELEDVGCWVDEEVLGFDVSVADSESVDVG